MLRRGAAAARKDERKRKGTACFGNASALSFAMTGGCSEYCRVTINYSADTKKTSEFLRALAEAGIETHALCGSFGKKNRLTFTTRAANVAAALRSVALLNTDGKRTKTRVEVCRTFDIVPFRGFSSISEDETPLSVSATRIEKAKF